MFTTEGLTREYIDSRVLSSPPTSPVAALDGIIWVVVVVGFNPVLGDVVDCTTHPVNETVKIKTNALIAKNFLIMITPYN